MAFQDIKDWLNQQKTSAQESITRFKNKEFLEAVVAGCALVAAADGTVDDSEKETMAGFIQRNDVLKVFDMSQVIASFNKFMSHFAFNLMVGKAEALKAVHRIKNNGDAARLLIRVCCAIGMADGDFDPDEKAAVKEICIELGLDPSEFGLAEIPMPADSSKPMVNALAVKRQEIERFNHRDFLEAVVAGCALVAAADGKIDQREKEAMTHFLQSNEAMQAFDTQEALAKFNKYTTNFDFSPGIGQAEARKAIQPFKANQEAARLLVRLYCDIGQADDQWCDEEKNVIRGICTDLALDPKEFSL